MKLTDLKDLRVIKKSLSPEPEKAPVQNQPSLLSKWGSSSPYNLDNLSTKWTFCHPLLPNSPFFRHWSQLCNILRRSDEEPGRKAT